MYTFIRRKKIKDSSVYLSNWFFIKILSAIWFHFRFVFRFISFHWIVFGVDCFNFVSCFDFFLSSESTYFVLCKNFTFDHFSVFIKNVDWMNAWTVFGCTVWNLQAWIGMHFRHVCVLYMHHDGGAYAFIWICVHVYLCAWMCSCMNVYLNFYWIFLCNRLCVTRSRLWYDVIVDFFTFLKYILHIHNSYIVYNWQVELRAFWLENRIWCCYMCGTHTKWQRTQNVCDVMCERVTSTNTQRHINEDV